MADISKITLPNNTSYNIKDAAARTDITNIKNVLGSLTGANAVVFRGVTSTALTDGGNENPTVNGSAVTTKRPGDVYFYGTHQFIYGTDNKWHEMGSLDTLGDFAYVDQGWVGVTPHGTITKPTITMGALSSPVAPRYLEQQGNVGTTQANYASNHTSNGTVYYIPEGTISGGTFTGSNTTFTGSFTPAGSVTLQQVTSGGTTITPHFGTAPTGQGQDPSSLPGYYKPAGNITGGGVKLVTAGATANINIPQKQTVAKTLVTAAPGASAPSNAVTCYSYDSSNQSLKLYQLGYTKGDSVIAATSDVVVKTGDGAYGFNTPLAFDGTPKIVSTMIKASWVPGVGQQISVSGTPQGSNSTASFTGKKVVLTAHGTPSVSSISTQTFNGQTEYWSVYPGVNEESEEEPGGGLTG